MGAGLYDAAVRSAADLGARVAFLGLWAPEIGGLDAFKLRMGAANRLLPAQSRLHPAAGLYLRQRRPLSHARLAGATPGFDYSTLAPHRPAAALSSP